jgi:DMSO/TMAO reductase YedYZ heme-binding membrane subunit
MKTYFAIIKGAQEFFLIISIIILATLPTMMAFKPDWFTDHIYTWLYAVVHLTLFFVMVIRPLADILRGVKWLRPLVILRKGVGVLSASIAVSFLLAKIIADGTGYLSSIFTLDYWSLTNLTLFAHLADLSAVILLITSNNLSKRLLVKNWKRIQRLSYVYFYASSIYVIWILGEVSVMFYVAIVTLVTILAWLRNHGYLFRSTYNTLNT